MIFFGKKTYYWAGLAVLVVCLAAGGGVYYFLKLRSFETIAVSKTDIYRDISARGKVVAANNIDLSFDTEGMIATIFVKKGGKVSFQDKLAQLDVVKLQAEIKQYQAQASFDKLKMSQLLSGTRVEEISLLESKVASARTGLDNARQESDDVKLKTENDLAEQYILAHDYSETVLLYADNAIKALGGIYTGQNKFEGVFVVPDSQKKSEAEWQIMLARSAFQNIKSIYDGLKSDSSRPAVDAALSQFKTNLEVIRASLQKTAEVFDTAGMVFGAPDIATFKTTVAVQRSNINSAQTTILTMEQNIASLKITAQVETNKAQHNIEQAESVLKAAEEELSLKKTAPREADLGLLQAQIKENEAYLEVLQDKLKNAIIKAPTDGVIGEVRKSSGVFVKAGDPVVSLVPSSDIQIEAVLDGDQSSLVKTGNEASVFFGDTIKAGKVVSVNGDKASIYLQEKTDGAAPGDEGDMKIRAVLKRGVILAPKNLVFEENGVKKINILEDGRKKTIAILIGEERGDQVEILEGVSDGDLLVE